MLMAEMKDFQKLTLIQIQNLKSGTMTDSGAEDIHGKYAAVVIQRI